MILTATVVSPYIEVGQEGGWGTQARTILRNVATGGRCQAGTRWIYPDADGTLISLREAAQSLQAELRLSSALEDRLRSIDAQWDQEVTVRVQMQRVMDEPTLPLPQYTTASIPVPWRHQAVAFHWGIRSTVLYLQHKPGLGKTRSAIDIARYRIDAGWVRYPQQVFCPPSGEEDEQAGGQWGIMGGILIVCPAVVIGTWVEELWRFQSIKATVIRGSREAKQRAAYSQQYVHVCTWGSLHHVAHNTYDGVIFDEMHCCAWDDRLRFTRALAIRRKAQWVIALSGTPVSNMLPSLWGQYYVLDYGRSLGGSFEAYRQRYFSGTMRKMEAGEGALEAISARISRLSYPLTMQQAFPDKPQKIHQIQYVECDQQQINYYTQIRTQTMADIQTGTVTTEEITVKIVKMLQVLQGFVQDDNGGLYRFNNNKIKVLEGMLTGLGDLTDRKVVVWCRFKPDLMAVCAMLAQHGIPHLHLHGGMPDHQREDMRHIWNSDPQYKVLVGMIQIGIGINLHAPHCVDVQGNPCRCSTTVFYGLDWSMPLLEQAMDRVYRGDQVESCLYRYLLTEAWDDSIPMDCRVYATLQNKLETGRDVAQENMDYVRSLIAS